MKHGLLRMSLLILVAFHPSQARGEVLSLKECILLAAKNNPSLQAEEMRPVIAAQDILQARSGYLPRVAARGAYTLQKDPQAVVISGRTEPTQEADFPSASLEVEQTLYDFGRTAARVDRAQALHDASVAVLRGERQDVFLRTIAAYYQILEAQNLRTAAAQEVAQFEDHLKEAQSLFRQGVVTRNNELQAEVQLAESRQLLLARENQILNAWLRLNYLTGRPPEARGELEEIFPFDLDAGESPAPASAVADRPELLAQGFRVQASRAAVLESRREFYPTVFARGGADYVKNRYVAEQTIWSATVGVRIPIFEGLTRVAAYRQASAGLVRDRRNLQALTEEAELEYRTALNDAQVAAARIRVAQQAIRQGEENLRITRNRYQEQVGTATEVIDAQTLLTRTRTDYYQSLLDYQLAVARVKRASGEL